MEVNEMIRDAANKSNKLLGILNNDYKRSKPKGYAISYENPSDKEKLEIAKYILVDLLEEYVNHLKYSMMAEKENKITISFSLLRKPIRDIISIVERIAIGPVSFAGSLLESDFTKYDLNDKNLRLDNIRKLKNKVQENHHIFTFVDEEFIDKFLDARYGNSANSLSTVLNQSLHLTTRDKNYKTIKKTLNMMPSNVKELDSLNDLLFVLYVYTYLYLLKLVEYIISKFFDENEYNRAYLKQELENIYFDLVKALLTLESNQTKNNY